ncbi:MAG: plasmid pRiA4b ORF-3 family protein [Ilumatobacter sp.]|uniref:plasmid pRiA4b ORF-3 family protein n=1 Tax=Ilumatobacter sp. TaxID=1967498 RepID=UPI0039193E34
MLIVRGTKKLRDRMKAAPVALPDDESTTVLGDWFATALFWKPQAALLVNTRTMIPVFTPLAPAGKLLDRAPAAIAEVLRAHGVAESVIEAELAEMSEVRLAATNDRQLLGVMNEFAFQGEGVWGPHDPDLFQMSMRLSELILGPLMKRHGTPADELAALFRPSADVISLPTATVNAAPTTPRVHQLKVTLRGTKPPIWRRVLVDGGQTLDHLHSVIQAAFGWWDSHLHEFQIDGTNYAIPDEDDWTPVRDERRVSIDQALLGARSIRYLYDFGDNWDHDIVIERTTRPDPDAGSDADAGSDVTVPDCIDGRRACPPEDCGGTWGYRELLTILADPTHPDHSERREWIGGPFDPDAFDRNDFTENLRLQQTIGRLAFDDLFTLDDDPP